MFTKFILSIILSTIAISAQDANDVLRELSAKTMQNMTWVGSTPVCIYTGGVLTETKWVYSIGVTTTVCNNYNHRSVVATAYGCVTYSQTNSIDSVISMVDLSDVALDKIGSRCAIAEAHNPKTIIDPNDTTDKATFMIRGIVSGVGQEGMLVTQNGEPCKGVVGTYSSITEHDDMSVIYIDPFLLQAHIVLMFGKVDGVDQVHLLRQMIDKAVQLKQQLTVE